MAQITLYFDPTVTYTTTILPMYFDNIPLKSGENQLSQQELERLRKHPDYIRYKNLGGIAIRDN
jgi:hypothetical protein